MIFSCKTVKFWFNFQLSEMRYELVPKIVKEDEFWKNYFYRVNLIKQSFDLKDLEDQSPAHKGE